MVHAFVLLQAEEQYQGVKRFRNTTSLLVDRSANINL
jgi:hypothetical protein